MNCPMPNLKTKFCKPSQKNDAATPGKHPHAGLIAKHVKALIPFKGK
jgi:hypothetical protein